MGPLSGGCTSPQHDPLECLNSQMLCLFYAISQFQTDVFLCSPAGASLFPWKSECCSSSVIGRGRANEQISAEAELSFVAHVGRSRVIGAHS